MPEPMRVNTVDAKNRLNELITEIEKTKKAIIVERRGQPVAVMVDYNTYEAGRRPSRQAASSSLSKELVQFHSRMRKKYPRGTGDSVEILREARSLRNRLT